ncbi:MAG: NAD(P)H-hydrate epimerase [bacterium]
MKLITAEQMRELDRVAIHERGVPSMDLMERAGKAVARCAASMIADGNLRKRALIFAGKGNNGGDAFNKLFRQVRRQNHRRHINLWQC